MRPCYYTVDSRPFLDRLISDLLMVLPVYIPLSEYEALSHELTSEKGRYWSTKLLKNIIDSEYKKQGLVKEDLYPELIQCTARLLLLLKLEINETFALDEADKGETLVTLVLNDLLDMANVKSYRFGELDLMESLERFPWTEIQVTEKYLFIILDPYRLMDIIDASTSDYDKLLTKFDKLQAKYLKLENFIIEQGLEEEYQRALSAS